MPVSGNEPVTPFSLRIHPSPGEHVFRSRRSFSRAPSRRWCSSTTFCDTLYVWPNFFLSHGSRTSVLTQMATAAMDGSLPHTHSHSHSRSMSQMSAAEMLRTPVSSNGSEGLPEGDVDALVNISAGGMGTGRRSGSFDNQRRWSKGSKGTGKGVLSVVTIEQQGHTKRQSGTGTFGGGGGGWRWGNEASAAAGRGN